MWSLTVNVIRYVSKGDETGHKMKIMLIMLNYRYRERQDMAHCTPLVTKLICRKNLLFIKLQKIEYEDRAMHR